MGSLVAELAEKLSSATNNFDIDEGTIYVNTSADTVGIGTTTPGSKLDVQGTMQVGVDDTGHDVKFFGATAGAYLEWDESADELEIRGGAATPGKLLLSTAETTVVDGNKLGQIDFQAPLDSAGTDAILVGASIHAEADATFSSSVNSTDLVFSTGDSEAATERMRIASTGNVGIGESSPNALLHLKNSSPSIYIEDSDTSRYVNMAYGSRASQFDNTMASGEDMDTVQPWFAFRFVDDGENRETMRINYNGNVGIGSTSPSALLDVSDNTDGGVAANMGNLHATGYGVKIRGASDGTRYALTVNNNADNTTFMRILGDGKVGIGTTAPDELLHLESGGNANIQLESTSGGGGTTLAHFKNVSKIYSIGIVGDGSHSLADTDFVIEDTSANAPRFQITNAGDIVLKNNSFAYNDEMIMYQSSQTASFTSTVNGALQTINLFTIPYVQAFYPVTVSLYYLTNGALQHISHLLVTNAYHDTNVTTVATCDGSSGNIDAVSFSITGAYNARYLQIGLDTGSSNNPAQWGCRYKVGPGL